MSKKGQPRGVNFCDRVAEFQRTHGVADCWLWPKPRADGYVQLSDYSTGKQRGVMAHRRVYEYLVGPIPEGLTLDHLCRNRACCNPAHLEPVTQRENIRRGEGRAALNVTKELCPKGHPLAAGNLHPAHARRGWRNCLTCIREQDRERKKARRRARGLLRTARHIPALKQAI